MSRFPPRRRRRPPKAARKLRAERLESRQMLAADVGLPLGATHDDTGEFLLGRVAVTPVFLESNGEIDPETQDWDVAEIDQMLAQITTSVNWWSDLLDRQNTVHELEFVIDDQFAKTPFEVPYEAIDRISNQINLPATTFLRSLGYGNASSVGEGIIRFNHDQRVRWDADWAFTIFVADSSDDPDGAFAPGGTFSTAFAFAGGQYIVSPSTRPVQTITHELGHIFYARDEYPGGGSWTDQRGYYNTQNTNAADNPTAGFVQEVSIMRSGQPLLDAYNQFVSPESTLAMLGWQDSDGDGVFDLADVPLHLDVQGSFDESSSLYQLTGSASAIPLINQNSWGNQSDITLNEISRLEVSVDGGQWQTLITPATPTVEIDLQFAIDPAFQSVRFRAIDDSTGITSPITLGTRTLPAITATGIRGGLFVDGDDDQTRDVGEAWLADAVVAIQDADGHPLPHGAFDPQSALAGRVLGDQDGVTFTVEGQPYEAIPAVYDVYVTAEDNRRLFHAFHGALGEWHEDWSRQGVLRATFEESVGTATVEVVGLEHNSYARMEAYDAVGNLVARQTTSAMERGEPKLLTVNDPHGRIHSVTMSGHADTEVGLGELKFGQASTVTTDASGTFRFDHLADGDYRLLVQPANLTHQVAGDAVTVEVTGGVAATWIAATVVDSPRHNAAMPSDVDGLHGVTAFDALLVINDLNRDGDRPIGNDELVGPNIDVNNDGMVSAIDALLVINHLNQNDGGAESGGGEGEAVPLVRPLVAAAGAVNSIPLSPTKLTDADESVLGETPESPREPAVFRVQSLAVNALEADSSDQEDWEAEADKYFATQIESEASPERLDEMRNFHG